ncbi:MAG: D-glycerate dehydrogenase [Ignavibacteriaceae bacterium]|jgi:glyoxylate reductase|nr:D-glycerate dehydrogenase [Ignavibacteriaceae bacterium]
MKIFITRQIPDSGINLLKKKGFEVSVYKKDQPITRKELIKCVKDCDGVISLLTDKIDKEVIDSMKKCRVIANYAVGFNNIDIAYAKSKGIIVTNTPDVLTDSTADLAIALVLTCARRIPESEKFVRDKKFVGWKPKLFLGIELRNKYFGILGAGRIGTETAKRAHSFGCNILYYSNNKNKYLEEQLDAKKLSLNQILKKSDIISLHLPLNSKTKNLLNEEKLKLLKSSAILVNTARGEMLDEECLIKKLKRKEIFAAGFDVYQNEPKLNNEFYKLKNAVLLPHTGSATLEARNKMSLLAAKNVAAVLSGKPPLTPV